MKAEIMTDIEKELSRGFTSMDYSKKGIWRGISKFKKSLGTDISEVSTDVFIPELEEQYGIKLKMETTGIMPGFAPEYQVVDEHKFMMFVLKYVQQ